MRIEEYLDAVCSMIKWRTARKPVREELRSHLLDRAEEYAAGGEGAERAEARAVENMGDAARTGTQLDRLHRPRYDKPFFIALIGLFAFGLLYCLTTQFTDVDALRWAVATLCAAAGGCLFTVVDIRRLTFKKPVYLSIYFFWIFLAILQYALAYVQPDTVLMYRFVTAAAFVMQPVSCVAMLLMLFSIGVWITHIQTSKGMLWFLASMALYYVLGYNPTFFFATWAMLWTVKGGGKALGLAVLPVIVVVLPCVVGLLASPEFSHMIAKPLLDTANPVLEQVRYKVMNLSLFGPGHLFPEIYPSMTNDSMYALLNFMWQYGLAAGLAVVGLCGVALWRVFKMLLGIRDAAGRAAAVGICAYLSLLVLSGVLENFGIGLSGNWFVGIRGILPMFWQEWWQAAFFGGMVGMLVGLYRRKDLYGARAVLAG